MKTSPSTSNFQCLSRNIGVGRQVAGQRGWTSEAATVPDRTGGSEEVHQEDVPPKRVEGRNGERDEPNKPRG